MFTYIYYAKGKGNHGSCDDVAIIRAWSMKQAYKILKRYIDTNYIVNFHLYRLKWNEKHCNKHVRWISEY